MDIQDIAILDRIERLAYQAGVASRGGGGEARVDAPACEPDVVRKLRAIGRLPGNSQMSGVAIYGANIEDNIDWPELIAWANRT